MDAIVEAVVLTTILSRNLSWRRKEILRDEVVLRDYAAGEKQKSCQLNRLLCVCDFTIVCFFSIKGWFYKDRFIGSEPNEKLKKQLKKRPKVMEDDAAPLPPPASLIL